MNILFYTTYRVSPTKGGIERATISVANGLNYYGCRCFSAFFHSAETSKVECFEKEYHWRSFKKAEGLKHFCQENQIDCIINQGEFSITGALRLMADELGCQVIFAHHFEPGWEAHFLTFHSLLSDLQRSFRIKSLLKMALFPYLKFKHIYTLPERYKEAYQKSDKVVLLCQGFISQYKEYGRFDDESKFVVIPNALSFDSFYGVEDIPQKKKVVLVVSRLEEEQKRLSLALKIWKTVKQHAESEGWILKLVGHGDDEKRYRQMVEKERIPDVSFLGRQMPIPYYQEALIFLMTSRSEGFGLTLIESQQFGVVPMAFNTYAAIADIIDDGKNGFVIPEGDVQMYVDKLLQLMADKDRRQEMAIHAMENSQRFSSKTITERWWGLLNNGKV